MDTYIPVFVRLDSAKIEDEAMQAYGNHLQAIGVVKVEHEEFFKTITQQRQMFCELIGEDLIAYLEKQGSCFKKSSEHPSVFSIYIRGRDTGAVIYSHYHDDEGYLQFVLDDNGYHNILNNEHRQALLTLIGKYLSSPDFNADIPQVSNELF